MIPEKFTFPESWLAVRGGTGSAFVKELTMECSREHVLFGRALRCIARRLDQDDFLFQFEDRESSFALVHLTFKGSKEHDPRWPLTKVLGNWDQVLEILSDAGTE